MLHQEQHAISLHAVMLQMMFTHVTQHASLEYPTINSSGRQSHGERCWVDLGDILVGWTALKPTAYTCCHVTLSCQCHV